VHERIVAPAGVTPGRRDSAANEADAITLANARRRDGLSVEPAVRQSRRERSADLIIGVIELFQRTNRIWFSTCHSTSVLSFKSAAR
jgi:hypothetical protein